MQSINKVFEDKVIFKNLGVRLFPGEKVAITGASGSGKSTFLKILSQEEKDYEGDVYLRLMDGSRRPLTRSDITIVHQSPHIFSISLRENLALYHRVTDKKMVEVLERVHLWRELGENLDLQIDQDSLSGGQKMRLELARSLLSGKSIFLVDEVTASLDEKNKNIIRHILKSLPSTVIEVTHQLKRHDFDRVLRIKHYELLEEDF